MKNQLMLNRKFLDVSTLLKKKQHFWQNKLLKKGLPIWKGKNSTIETKINKNQLSRNQKMIIYSICSNNNKKNNRRNWNRRKKLSEVYIRNRFNLFDYRKMFLKLTWMRKRKKKNNRKRNKKRKKNKKNLLKLRNRIRSKKIRKKKNRKKILIKSLKIWDVILF
jgi:hypothetical protein